jgi:hypothetical protein
MELYFYPLMKNLSRYTLVILALVLCPSVWAKKKDKTASASETSSSSSSAANSSATSTPATAASSSAAMAKIYTKEQTDPLITLANATLAAVAADKKADMETKITELESAWDAQEKTLKPINQAQWTVIDKTLDKAIAALRGSKFDAKKGKDSLDSLVKMLTDSTK